MSNSKLLAGRYELIEKIGDGGMAVVYKAKDRLLNRYVAVKILRPEYTRDAQFIESFKKESQAAAGLQHPNIVNVYDVGKEGNIYFIVMELIDGRPLSDIIEEHGPLDYKHVIQVGKQVAAALSLAHKNHIIHRDVKPHNIMITKDGVAKLADFGIAKAISSATIVNKEDGGQVMGSVHYFSPEQARGKYVDEKSDVYSLGIVLYEMLTGKVPFDGDNPVEIALMHINEDIKPPSTVVDNVPPALEKIILKATDKYQNNRYENAEAMYEDLNNVDFLSKKVGDEILLGAAGRKNKPVKIDDANEEKLNAIIDDKGGKKSGKKKGNSSGNSPSGFKKALPWILALIVLLILGAVGGYLLTSKMSDPDKGNIEVPDLKGMTYEEASDELSKIKLNIEKGDDVYSADIEKGKIVSQTPISKTKVKEGTKVKVNISKGKKAGLVPDLIGKKYNESDISSAIGQYGFVLGNVTYEESDKYDEGIIINQTPSAGSSAKSGSSVDIVVSKGKNEKAKVPTLTGLTADDAVQALNQAGFEVGDISYEESSIYGKDYVMWQQYSAGTELKKGTSVSLKISKGVPQVPDQNNSNSDNKPDNGHPTTDQQ